MPCCGQQTPYTPPTQNTARIRADRLPSLRRGVVPPHVTVSEVPDPQPAPAERPAS